MMIVRTAKKPMRPSPRRWLIEHRRIEMNNMFLNVQISSSMMTTMMAEDVGAAELRNPLNSGMKAKGILSRFFSRRKRSEGKGRS